MTAKTSAARRAAFLKALAQTGNQTLAAEAAKVSRSWVTKARAEEPAFDAAVREARAAAEARLDALAAARVGGSGAGSGVETGAPKGWRFFEGEELVVRGTGGSDLRAPPPPGARKGRRVQVARARLRQWSPRVEARFLDALAQTANVKAACAAVGMAHSGAYAHRRRWSDFARRWDETLDDAAARLDAALLARGGNLFSGEEEGSVDNPIRPMCVSEAIWILEMHHRRQAGHPKVPGRWRRPPTLEEVRESILRKVEAIRRSRPAGEGRG